jgi:hypothetical protein
VAALAEAPLFDTGPASRRRCLRATERALVRSADCPRVRPVRVEAALPATPAGHDFAAAVRDVPTSRREAKARGYELVELAD